MTRFVEHTRELTQLVPGIRDCLLKSTSTPVGTIRSGSGGSREPIFTHSYDFVELGCHGAVHRREACFQLVRCRLECFISLDLSAPQSAVYLPTQRVETVFMPPDSDEQRCSRRRGWQRLRRRLIGEELESPHRQDGATTPVSPFTFTFRRQSGDLAYNLKSRDNGTQADRT